MVVLYTETCTGILFYFGQVYKYIPVETLLDRDFLDSDWRDVAVALDCITALDDALEGQVNSCPCELVEPC